MCSPERREMTNQQGDLLMMFTTIGLTLLTVFLSLSTVS